VFHLLEDMDRVLAAAQLGITMASLAIGWIGEAAIAQVIEPLFAGLPPLASTGLAHSIGLMVSFTLITALHIVIGEQAPKTIAIRYPERVSMLVSQPITAFDRLFRPFIWVLDRASETVLNAMGVESVGGHRTIYTVDELKQLVTESTEGGELEAEEQQMIHRVFEFADRQVHEVMIPRPDIVGLQKTATLTDLLAQFRQYPHARFPIYEENLDNIVGVVAIKDVLRCLAEDPQCFNQPLHDLIRPAYFVPESKPIGDLLAEMRRQQQQMAVVIDEFGGTAGIVTAEELVEEIVGRLSDELVSETPMVETIDERTVQVDAGQRVDEINDGLNLNLPEADEYETLAGFVLHHLRRIPKEGECFRYNNLQLTVTVMKGPKIEKVLIRKL